MLGGLELGDSAPVAAPPSPPRSRGAPLDLDLTGAWGRAWRQAELPASEATRSDEERAAIMRRYGIASKPELARLVKKARAL